MTTKKKRLANQLTQLINSKLEKQLKAEIQLFFQKQMDEVLSAFDEYYTDTLLLQGHINLILSPIHELQKEYYDLLLKYNTEIYNRGKEQGRRQVDGMALKSAKPLKWHHDENKPTDLFGTLPTSEQHLTSYTFTASESTMNRVDGEINRILTEGYRDGLGVKDVRNRIMERYQQFTGWEANRIARTEMQTAHNMGVMQTYQEMGVEYKEWRSAHDKRTRRSHSLLDGEVAPLDKPFSNGLMYPGDKSGPIEEWINCRCSFPPFIMPPGMMAPPGMAQFRVGDLVSVTEPNYDQLLRKETGGAIGWEEYRQILQGKPVNISVGATVRATQTQEEPTTEQLQTNLTKQEREKYQWAKDVQTSEFISDTGKAKARETLEQLRQKALGGTPKPKSAPKPVEPVKPKPTPVEPKPTGKSVESMTSQELYESMTKADKKKYDKFKKKVETADKNIKQLGENPILLDMKKKNLMELRKLEQKQRTKLENKGKRKPKTEPVRTNERTLDNIHKEIEVPTDELIPQLEKWIDKRCKNTAEFGYHFDVKTGKLIGEEIRGKKGRITISDTDKQTGSIHSHPRNGMSAPSIEDLETFRCKKEQHHFMVSEHEIWYVKATDNFGIGGMGQQLDLQDAHKACRDRAFERVSKLVKKGKIEATEEALAKALDKYTGDEILKTFNSPPWNKTMTVKRYYR